MADMNRIGIYFFYDKDGIVDDYVPYFLKKLKPFCSRLVVVASGKLTVSGRKKLESFSDKLIIRPNQGFDSWAYKDAIEDCGYDSLKKYDELLLCNFTFFGPIYPLSELFSSMEKKECDFWGINRHPPLAAEHAGVRVIEHIQSHFIVFRNKILTDTNFEKYWKTLKPVNSYDEAIAHHELRCTRFFEDLGYKSADYLDYKKYLGLYEGNSSVLLADQQIIEDRSPILKRKFFYIDKGRLTFPSLYGNNLDLIRFIKTSTDYDTGLIYQNLIRTQNLSSLKHNRIFNLRFYKYNLFARMFFGRRDYYREKLKKFYRNYISAEDFEDAFQNSPQTGDDDKNFA